LHFIGTRIPSISSVSEDVICKKIIFKNEWTMKAIDRTIIIARLTAVMATSISSAGSSRGVAEFDGILGFDFCQSHLDEHDEEEIVRYRRAVVGRHCGLVRVAVV
jgi:hypothetical protein